LQSNDQTVDDIRCAQYPEYSFRHCVLQTEAVIDFHPGLGKRSRSDIGEIVLNGLREALRWWRDEIRAITVRVQRQQRVEIRAFPQFTVCRAEPMSPVNRILFATKPIRQLLLAHWLPPAFAVGAESPIVVYVQVRGLPASFAGLLLACVPVGMIIGNLVVGRLLVPGPRLAAPLVVLVGLPFVAFPADPHPAILCVLTVMSGIGFSYTLGIQKAFLAVVPVSGRGQAFGLLSTGLQTLQGIGPACFGALAEIIHPSTAIAAAGGATVLTASWLWLRMRGGLQLVETRSSGDQQGPVPQQTGLRTGGHLGDDRAEERDP
jgi:hypothetical protein